MPKKSTRR
uniref:Uncharacterized protein n=1 Tax=Arundo donax TaxID=35708 RepID=A0A0A9Q3X2_ARUDO